MWHYKSSLKNVFTFHPVISLSEIVKIQIKEYSLLESNWNGQVYLQWTNIQPLKMVLLISI